MAPFCAFCTTNRQFLRFLQRFFSAYSAFFAAHTRERGIHRRDAENFEFLFGQQPDKALNPNIRAPEVEVGGKEGRVRRAI